MDSSSTVHVIAANASLRPLLQAASWDGAIAAVFHRSILCSASDERLLHLHTGPRLVSPFSLRIEEDFANVLREVPLVQGRSVQKIGSAIKVAAHVHLCLDEITYYQSPSYVMEAIDPEAIRIAWQVLRAHGRFTGIERIPGLQTLAAAIRQALANGHPAQLLEAARHLIGLGPGLTPSGDDVLAGCLRGLWLIRRNQPAACQMLDCLRNALLPDLDSRTTPVGAEFIRYALDGAFAEVLDQAALALLAPSHPQVVQSAIGLLLTQGETSGTDTTLGLLTSLEALLFIPNRESRHEWQDTPATFSLSAARRG